MSDEELREYALEVAVEWTLGMAENVKAVSCLDSQALVYDAMVIYKWLKDGKV